MKAKILSNRGSFEAVTDDSAYDQAAALARRVGQPGVGGACIVFANSDSGEGYIQVDGNYGDRNNLTLWQRGDDLINQVAGNCSNTVVIAHTPGPILMEPWIQHPNVTPVLLAGLPGKESGNSLVEAL